MITTGILKQFFINTTGYWIYKKKHLPLGVDLIHDINFHFGNDSINTIFDIGANEGQSALRYSAAFKKAQIYSFEPEKELFQKLKENTRHLSKVELINMGMGDKRESKTLYHGKYSAWNSVVPGLNQNGSSSKIQVTTIDEFADEKGLSEIDLLKTDTEGFDLSVLNGGRKLLNSRKIKLLCVETGFYSENRRNTEFNQVQALLSQMGYILFALYDQAKGGTVNFNANALFVKT